MTIGTGNLASGDVIALFPFFRRARPPVPARRPLPLDAATWTDRVEERLPVPTSASMPDRPDGGGSGRADGDDDDERDVPSRAGRERLEVRNARIRLPTAQEPGTAGYGVLANETSATATLVALECPAFDRVEMRESIVVGDVTVMRTVHSLTVLPGDGVEFAPGIRHLMLSGQRQPLEEGQLVGITMVFASGRRRVVPFRIGASRPTRSRDGR